MSQSSPNLSLNLFHLNENNPHSITLINQNNDNLSNKEGKDNNNTNNNYSDSQQSNGDNNPFQVQINSIHHLFEEKSSKFSDSVSFCNYNNNLYKYSYYTNTYLL